MSESGVIEIRWHGRGGQGVVTAARLLAGAALRADKYFQAFPEFGPERMGAPIVAFNRISSRPFSNYSQISNPDVVVVIDPTLLGAEAVIAGVGEDAIFIANSSEEARPVAGRLGLEPGQVYVVDASRIARETIGRDIPNTAMLGGVVGITEIVPLDDVIEELKELMGEKLGSERIEGNIEAIRRTFETIRAR
ncbi:MAG: hypothetical protein AMJ46_07715 [Latescibacteria bacterium DG_63]|jgi:pyruvate ferredoxin oxidoreductase gamma subunit|uniref:Pyruvate/ketoisovalerate oxidoreductase catalytic domain-containing protein n=2 Tax=Bacteria division TA06 TaxID=1156500 RepID=A0A0S8JMY2_UNCT6|nr:MAG: hypothetical protein AMJ46_07715 [Latescibacteria bacterium DG_63]KPK69533.1 MAG: hypothetical protein AMJ82_05275 [candidate division TA06 bacterium SM23_40]KPL10786.1 MAG: hypothetical protein AMJ71_01965 [candidate division TA06 bacterium SM1_40]